LGLDFLERVGKTDARHLSIRNVVLIDQLDLSFEAGLCTLTGETGAGKSILLDAWAWRWVSVPRKPWSVPAPTRPLSPPSSDSQAAIRLGHALPTGHGGRT
jgi:hypothetical protein